MVKLSFFVPGGISASTLVNVSFPLTSPVNNVDASTERSRSRCKKSHTHHTHTTHTLEREDDSFFLEPHTGHVYYNNVCVSKER